VNFWSLLNKLIIYLIQNSDIIRRGVSVLLRSTRCVLLYAPRNREDWPLIVHVALSEGNRPVRSPDPSDPTSHPTRRPIRPAYPATRPIRTEEVEASVMHDVRVRAAYERTPRVPRQFSLPINRMRGLPRKGLISLLSLTILPRFPCPFKPEALVFLLKSRGSILLPRFPRIPRKIRFPRRNSARFSISLSSNFQVSSYPLQTHFKYILNAFILF